MTAREPRPQIVLPTIVFGQVATGDRHLILACLALVAQHPLEGRAQEDDGANQAGDRIAGKA